MIKVRGRGWREGRRGREGVYVREWGERGLFER